MDHRDRSHVDQEGHKKFESNSKQSSKLQDKGCDYSASNRNKCSNASKFWIKVLN